jgi:peptidoglycan hydrolase CwlO-like protein
LDQEELKELKRLVADELQDLDHVVQSHEDGINSLIAEKAEDRSIMRSIQMRLESLHRRVVKLEQKQPPTGK